MTSENVIMLLTENTETEIVRVRNVNEVIKKKEVVRKSSMERRGSGTIGVYRSRKDG